MPRETPHSSNESAPARGTSEDPVRALRDEIARQEDLVYGFALFFEGISFLYSGQEAVILTYRKQLRNVIQTSRQVIEQATSLLAQAEKDPSKAHLLAHVRFSPGQGHPQPDELCRRARVLVEAYHECFPDRPRSEPFSEHEIVRLLDVAADRLGGPLSP
jgi:hypothetical protein